MAKIVCTSCSHEFESTDGEEGGSTCPACGHVHESASSDEAPDPEGGGDPFDGMEEEMVFDMDDDVDPSSTETADYGAVLPSVAADEPAAEESAADESAADEPAAEESAADEPAADEPAADESSVEPEAEEDTRWRFRSGSGLVLFFPTYEVATKWVIKQNPADISIARGSGEFRPYVDFEAQLKITGDPLVAIQSEPSGDAPEEARSEGAEVQEEAEPSSSEPSAEGSDVAAEVSPPAARPPRKKNGESTTTKTSEFQFRTGQEVKVWPGRILFLILGLLIGGGGVYYAAWYGLLPGILY